MCNLYAMQSSQAAIREVIDGLTDRTGNLPELPGIYPDYAAPIVRNGGAGPELVMARWGMPSPAFVLRGKKVDKGVTNIRNTRSPHWRRWLAPAHRCLVPFTAFSEQTRRSDGSFEPVWFAGDESRPLRFFAGLWTQWTSVRKIREGEITADLFGFLTTEPNALVARYHPKAMPVILQSMEDAWSWLEADVGEALALQSPLPEGQLVRV